ncbi:C-reactive protein-like [Odontesthes bonariensis]|uniref:C-reactive protein-like n=1 Tax=Odontesthes bonariensis TaxID=219752 RepID=UPI003F58C770
MKLLILLVMLTSCAALPQNLLGKIFTFPQQTNTAQVRLTTSRQNLKAVTVCLRSFTDLKREHSLFSLATPSKINDFLIYKSSDDTFQMYARDVSASINELELKQNTWHSICATWDATSGLAQLWVDGKPSSRKFTSTGSINGTIVIVLGQEQDAHGGGFDAKQSFVGMMCDVHMWDYILSPCEMQSYVDDLNFTPGNVLNWRALEYEIFGRVLLENRLMVCH